MKSKLRKNKKFWIITTVIFFLIIAYPVYFLVSPFFIDVEVKDTVPEEFKDSDVSSTAHQIIYKGNLTAHFSTGTGEFEIIAKGNEKFLKIDNFEFPNGPDLHFVLSNENSEWDKKDFTIISELRGNKGNIFETIPEEINISDYKYILVHCVRFAHTFGYAELKE